MTGRIGGLGRTRAMLRSLAGIALVVFATASGPAVAGERAGSISFELEIKGPPGARRTRLWFPYPTSDSSQVISNLRFEGTYSRFTLSREPNSGALYLYLEWKEAPRARRLAVTFDVLARERRAGVLVDRGGEIPAEVRTYLESDFWIPADAPRVRELATRITSGRAGTLARARAIYDWTVANTRRDPRVPGCGLGVVEATLASRSGKCADISSVFVALARAAGVPAREVFGLRLGLPGQVDITDGHHCWAEFYLPGTGWVPVDPADVTRFVLEKGLDQAAARPYADYYFGSVDQFRIVLHRGGRGVSFPEGNAAPVNSFMYPYAFRQALEGGCVEGVPDPESASHSGTLRKPPSRIARKCQVIGGARHGICVAMSGLIASRGDLAWSDSGSGSEGCGREVA